MDFEHNLEDFVELSGRIAAERRAWIFGDYGSGALEEGLEEYFEEFECDSENFDGNAKYVEDTFEELKEHSKDIPDNKP
eukprot:9449834-Alexandrium_andersonii.AAC.1